MNAPAAAAETFLLSAGKWAWETSIVGSVLVIVVMLIQTVLGRTLPPRGLYWLWLLVGLRLLMPAVPAASWSVLGWTHLLRDGSPESTATNWERSTGDGPPIVLRHTAVPATPSAPSPSQLPASPAADTAASGQRTLSPAWRTRLPLIWLAGTLSYLLIVLARQRRFVLRLNKEGRPGGERLAELVEHSRKRLGLKQRVQPLLVDNLSGPAIFGVIRPRLLLPGRTLAKLSDQELSHVVLHELIHVRSRDVLLNWILISIQALHWFNPIVWYALRRLRAAREIVRDSEVLSVLSPAERPAYGRTLLRLIPSLPTPSATPGLALAAQHKHDIERRITMISRHKSYTRLATIISVLMVLSLATITFTRAADQETSKPSEATRPTNTAAPASAAPTRADDNGPANPPTPERQARNVRLLETELHAQEDLLRLKEAALDELKERFQISASAEPNQGNPSATDENFGHLEKLRMTAQAERDHLMTIKEELERQKHRDLINALPTVVPDRLLTVLLQKQAEAEVKVAQTNGTRAQDHPDQRSLHNELKTLNQQIDQRVAGILRGLAMRIRAEAARVESLDKQMAQAREREIQQAIEARPYWDKLRETESQRYILERLRMRVWQEKLEAKLDGE